MPRVKRDWNKPSLYGRGFMSKGKYNCTNSKKARSVWEEMFRRCYNEKFQEKNKTYFLFEVSENWYNFQNFAEWFYKNYVDSWHLDKDILTDGGFTYGDHTCCFVPRIINNQFEGWKGSKNGNLRGVEKDGNSYHSSMSVKGKKISLGWYKTPEEAHEVWRVEKNKYISELAETYKDQLSEKVYNKLKYIT